MDKDITRYFPQRISDVLMKYRGNDLHEIRIRPEKPLAGVLPQGIFYFTLSGKLSSKSSDGIIITYDEVHKIFDSLCGYSIHSHAVSIKNSFITVNKGHRAGISGTAVINENNIETVKDISGINFRIARQYIGIADKIMNETMKGCVKSVLLFGEPSSGKTTVLRDLCRQIGNKTNVSLIDERFEIASSVKGISQNDVGVNTDVFTGFSKSEGIIRALRVMSPSVIICDEIGTNEDLFSIKSAFGCGVKIIATIHAESERDLFKRKNICDFLLDGYFDEFIHIKKGSVEKIISYENFRTDYDNFCADFGRRNNV